MRILLSLILAALVCGSVTHQAIAQQVGSKTGTVAAKNTGIEVTSPITNRKLPNPVDGKVTAYAEAILKQNDKNANGSLESDELKTASRVVSNGDFDTDKDGVITLDEIAAGLSKRMNREEPVAAFAAEKPARKLIAFEFVLIERSSADLADEKNKAPTAAQLLQLEKDGKAASVQRLKITALENVEARLQLGEEAPFVTSRAFAGAGGRGGFAGGGGQEQVTYNSLGTTLTLTAETESEGKVLASINLARSTVAALKAEKPADKVEGQEAGVSTNYPRRLQSTIVRTVRLAAGETAILCGQQTHTGSSPSELWVLVLAVVQ